jgi:hypothetical protein
MTMHFAHATMANGRKRLIRKGTFLGKACVSDSMPVQLVRFTEENIREPTRHHEASVLVFQRRSGWWSTQHPSAWSLQQQETLRLPSSELFSHRRPGKNILLFGRAIKLLARCSLGAG